MTLLQRLKIAAACETCRRTRRAALAVAALLAAVVLAEMWWR